MMDEVLTAAYLEKSAARPRKVIRPTSFSIAGVFGDLRELMRYRDLIYTLSQHRVRVRYKQSVLGIAWAVMQPLSLMLIYTVIFSMVARIETNGVPYAIFVFVALLPWTYFATSLTSSTTALTSHIGLINKVYFPREILPLTYVIAAFFDFIIACLVLAAMMVYYRVPLTTHALYAIPIVVVITVFATAMALFFSATQVRFRDVGVGIPLLLQIWMFATPVVYPLAAIKGLSPTLQLIYMANPMVGVIENFRRVVLEGTPPDLLSLGVAALISFILLPIAYIYFKNVEATAADII